jgi:glutamine---fructose-6-phosphate transaminase (isomerizing)
MYLTYQEIKDQYKALQKTTDCINGSIADVKKLFDRAKPRMLVFFGCGSSYSLAKSMALAAQVHLGIPAIALAAGDYMLHNSTYSAIAQGSRAVVISRSGSTSEVIAAVEHLKAAAASSVLSICCLGGTRLAELSDLTIEMPWCFDKSVCQTRTVSNLYMAGMLLIARLSGNDKLAEGLDRAVVGGNSFLSWYENELKFVASKFWTHAVVLADAELAGIAEEGALAFKEICQKPSNFYHLLDSRHGPMVLIGKDTLVIAALSDGNQYELDLVADVARKGAELIVYSDIPLDGLPEKVLNISFGKSLPHAARGLPLVLIAQLISYYRAVVDGINPDEPGGLSPWIKL